MIGFDAPSVWKARNRGFSMGTVVSQGHLVHLTGQVAWDANEQIVGQHNVGMQTRQCFANIAALLDEVGGSLDDIVNLTTWYTSPDQLAAIQLVRHELLGAPGPASTSVMVAGLGHRDFLVELTPVAVIPEDRFRAPTNLET